EGQAAVAVAGGAPRFALRAPLEWVEQRGEQWKYPELWDKDGRRRPNAKPVLYAEQIGGLGMFFDARLRAQVQDGTVSADAFGIHVRGATEALLIFAARTSFNGAGKSPSRDGSDAA